MNRIRYDTRNPDPSVLRQAVFTRLREGWGQVERSDFGGRMFRQGFDQILEFIEPSPPLPEWERTFMMAATDLLWQLVNEGVIRPGGTTDLNFPFMTVTEYGRRVIASGSAHPHHVERFLDQIRDGQQVDPTVEAYLVESLHSFRQDRLVATVILLGVAAERTFLLISEALLEALRNPSEQSEFKKVLERQPMKPKLDWVHGKLLEFDGRRPKLPGYPESTPLMVTGIYNLIRQQRNDLGHPRDIPPEVGRQQVESSLVLFANFYGDAENLRSYFAARKGAL